jgi:hypothetical protein
VQLFRDAHGFAFLHSGGEALSFRAAAGSVQIR